MLGLTAFLIVSSIGIVINQQVGRKAMVVTEANTVGIAWLRAGFIDEPDSTSVRDLLREFNEVIDIHSLRLTAIDRRLPRTVGILLFVATLLSFLFVGVVSSADQEWD